jgi:hypothetical protein
MWKRVVERLAGTIIVIQGVIGIVSWVWGLWALPTPAPSSAGPPERQPTGGLRLLGCEPVLEAVQDDLEAEAKAVVHRRIEDLASQRDQVWVFRRREVGQ